MLCRVKIGLCFAALATQEFHNSNHTKLNATRDLGWNNEAGSMSGLLLSSGEDDFKRRLASLVSEPCCYYYDTSGSYVNKICDPPGYSL